MDDILNLLEIIMESKIKLPHTQYPQEILERLGWARGLLKTRMDEYVDKRVWAIIENES